MAAIGNTGGTPAPAGPGVRQMAVAKAANLGGVSGGVGAGGGAAEREQRQDNRERQQRRSEANARKGIARPPSKGGEVPQVRAIEASANMKGVTGGVNASRGGPRPIPNVRPQGTAGTRRNPARYGSNRNYPQTV